MLTRGVYWEVNKFIADLQAIYYPFKYKGKDFMRNVGVRPIQLWEVAFAKEELPKMLKSIWRDGGMSDTNLPLKALRMALKAKKIPKLDLSKTKYNILSKDGVAVYPVGIKQDKYDEENQCESI